MRKYLICFLCILTSSASYAQKDSGRIKPIIEAGIGPATGVSRLVYTKFLNVRGGAVYSASEKVDLLGSLGYVYFFRKKNKTGVSFVPLTAGVDYRMSSKIFIEMQMGGAFLIEDKALYFIIEPGGGFHFDNHNTLRISYNGFVTNGLVIGGISFTYRHAF